MSAPRPAPASMKDLAFERQSMTSWFSPQQLVRTGIHAVLSSVFGAYADKRELQAALDVGDPTNPKGYLRYDVGADGEFWMDYVADLGDGFDPTYTVAYLLAQPKLKIPCEKGAHREPESTRRADLLMMGGDQVYPSATRDEYRNRLYGPYEAAMHWSNPPHPHLYAIPGNHDWYDGLTSFMRLFGQQRWIGGWHTRQKRSYFAARLPNPWWLWGIDLQLTADIDDPQLKYFKTVARDLQPGDRLIVCTPGPNWVRVGMGEPRAFDILDYFLKETVPQGVSVSVVLTGDLHHYARYATRSGDQFITAGGGGAYLYPTHNLPRTVKIESEDKQRRVELELKSVYPESRRSRALAAGAAVFLRANLPFGMLLGFLYLLFAWVLESASGAELLGALATRTASEWTGAVAQIWDVLWRSPGASTFALIIVGGLCVFATTDRKDRWRVYLGRLVGAVHGAVHIVLAWALMWAMAAATGLTPHATGGPVFLFIAGMFVAGSIAGALLMGLYLFGTNQWPKLHDNEAFSSQGIRDYKNFLRLRFKRDGSLTIYPVAIHKVTTSWQTDPAATAGQSWIVPQPRHAPLFGLAEPPITLAGVGVVAGPLPSPPTGARV